MNQNLQILPLHILDICVKSPHIDMCNVNTKDSLRYHVGGITPILAKVVFIALDLLVLLSASVKAILFSQY